MTANGNSLTRIKLEQFTAFSKLDLPLSSGINVLVGENGTGKTHVMKVCYAACCVSSEAESSFMGKLVRVFLPHNRAPGRLVKRQKGSARGVAEVHRGDRKLRVAFSNHVDKPDSGKISTSGIKNWKEGEIKSVYIPVKEMLSNAPGFLSLYEARAIHFEEVYRDILLRAHFPRRRGPTDQLRKDLLSELQKKIGGEVTIENEEFFLRNRQGNLEFTLLAEGMRKLGLLWLLIQNGILQEGSVLFWDEPETNLNPKLFGVLIDILLKLQRTGVQIFLATHDYVILKELDLQMETKDKVGFHSLYREGRNKNEIACHTADNYLGIHPNAIAETFTGLYDREVDRSLKNHG